MGKKTLIIAEAGANHNGSLDTAFKLVDAAVEAGSDIVKFQTGKADKVISKYAAKAEYQKKTSDVNESQLEMCRKLDLDYPAHSELNNYCQQKRIAFLSSPFDLDSIDMLNGLGLNTFKIPSGEITNLPYLQKIGSFKKKIILSTGMSDLSEVGAALDILTESGTNKEDITVLHCNTEYPTPYADVNLLAMLTIKEAFGVKVGYSDHTLGIEVSIAAVALGASIIEKHLTLDRNMRGPDHKASLEPEEFKRMVTAVRNIEVALGDGTKKPSPSEQKNIVFARKSIVAAKDIAKGDIFSEENLVAKRPGSGIDPMQWGHVLGIAAKRNFGKDELIEL